MKYFIILIIILTRLLSFGQMKDKSLLTFKVSDVNQATKPLKTDSAKKIFENKLGYKIQYAPSNHLNAKFVYSANNTLIQTIQECYDNHRPLVLSPDIIWLSICQGISIHINENFDSLKKNIYKNDKIEKITIRNDSLGSNQEQWPKLISSLSIKTKELTNGDIYSLFIPNFSTTGSIENTVFQITLLESLKKGFEYVGESGCGIPSITLKGKKSDWEEIKSNLNRLDKYGLNTWANNLKPLIDEFINVYDNKINTDFWQSIYKNASEYNAFYISGWIVKFFPYKKTIEFTETYVEDKGTMVIEKYKLNEFMEGNKYMKSTLSTDDFPTGISKIDLTWNDFYKNKSSELSVFGGFFAILQHPDLSLEPLITWAICNKKSKSNKHSLAANKSIELIHKKDYWSPHFAKKLTNKAIYDIKTFDSQEKSVQFIKTMIEDSVSKSIYFKEFSNTKISIEFSVYSNGTVDDVIVNKNKNMTLTNYISKLVSALPKPWYPALAHPTDILWIIDADEKLSQIKVKTNSKVNFSLF